MSELRMEDRHALELDRFLRAECGLSLPEATRRGFIKRSTYAVRTDQQAALEGVERRIVAQAERLEREGLA